MLDKKNVLDQVVINIEGNPWTVRDACTGVMVLGMTGSGKSSGPLREIACRLLTLGYGGVVFCAKPDECDTWKKYATQVHRSEDLLFLSEQTFNYLEHESRRVDAGGGQIENLVNLYMEIVNMGKGTRGRSNENDEYWQAAVKQLLRNSMTILRMAGEAISIENIHRVIISAPGAINDANPEKCNYCADLMDIGIPAHLRTTPEYNIARSFFHKEFANLDERTRSNTISSFSVSADAMQRDELARCFSAQKSTLHLEDIYRKRKILIVDYDQKSWGRLGQYAAGIIKYCFEMMIERREDIALPDAIPCFLWADECQFFALDYDQKFQTTARSSRAITVYATQNLGNLYDGYGKEKASSLLGNLGTKIFCQNGEYETNEWAAKSIGQEIVMRKNLSYGDSLSSSMKGDDNKSLSYSESFSEQKDYRVDPADFTTLQTGGPRGQCKVGFIMWQSGRVFNNGTVFVHSNIEQECKQLCGARRPRHCPEAPATAVKNKHSRKPHIISASDYCCFVAFILSLCAPLAGGILIYTNHDITFGYFNSMLYCRASTLCFYMLGLSLDILCSCLKRAAGILNGKTRNAKKHLKSIIWQDAVLGYYTISFCMTLWLQYYLFTPRKVIFILVCWLCLCMFFRFLRSSSRH
ncbi:MAG: TraM recognition domain-containing protein [Victivallales bacterium]|nr:TraM recognition domain-containing protein [Victivallales bacterium]